MYRLYYTDVYDDGETQQKWDDFSTIDEISNFIINQKYFVKVVELASQCDFSVNEHGFYPEKIVEYNECEIPNSDKIVAEAIQKSKEKCEESVKSRIEEAEKKKRDQELRQLAYLKSKYEGVKP